MGRNALHSASRANNIKAVDFLLNNTEQLNFMPQGEFRRSMIDSRTRAGETALILAVDEGTLHVMQLLFS